MGSAINIEYTANAKAESTYRVKKQMDDNKCVMNDNKCVMNDNKCVEYTNNLQD